MPSVISLLVTDMMACLLPLLLSNLIYFQFLFFFFFFFRSWSMAYLYQGRWSRFFRYCHGRDVALCKATVQQIAELFLYLHRVLKMSVSATKRYRSALNRVFIMNGTDLASNRVISGLFSSFKKSCLPRKSNHQIGTCLWSLRVLLAHHNCPRMSIWAREHAFF